MPSADGELAERSEASDRPAGRCPAWQLFERLFPAMTRSGNHEIAQSPSTFRVVGS